MLQTAYQPKKTEEHFLDFLSRQKILTRKICLANFVEYHPKSHKMCVIWLVFIFFNAIAKVFAKQNSDNPQRQCV